METDVTYFARSLPHFIRLQPFAGMRLAEIAWNPQAARPLSIDPATLNRWWHSLPLEQVDLFCIHGVQEGALYPILLPWLQQDPKRRVLFLEENPQTLLSLLHTEWGFLLVSHPQIGLYWLEGGESQRLLLTQLTWDFFHLRWHFIPHACSHALTQAEITHKQRLYEDLEGIQIHAQILGKELLTYGEHYFTNFYANLPLLECSDCGDRLFKKFADLPILICGSGPSLHTQIPLLRLIRDRALILAAGSAVAVLLAHGILPDFGVAIDPTLSQAERLERQIGLDIPYFYRPRIHPRALQAMKGRRLYVSGTGAYEVPLYIEHALKFPKPQVDEGHNVLHFALSIAQCMQGKPSKRVPLILLGADGAYRDEQEYSPGIPASSRIQAEDERLKTLREDAQGNLLVTRKQWIAERSWFTQFARTHSKTLLINATAGGLPIEGIPNLSLQSCIARYCTRTYDVSGRVWSELQRIARPTQSTSRIAKILTQWKLSLSRIEAAMRTAEQEVAQGNSHLVPYAEAAWQCENAYHPILSLFERIYMRLQRVQEQHCETLAPPLREAEEQRLLAERLHFLERGCTLHHALLSKIESEQWKNTQAMLKERAPPPPSLHGKDRIAAIQSIPKRGAIQEGKTLFKSRSGILLAEGHFQKVLSEPLGALCTSSRGISVRREVPDGVAGDEGIAPAIAEEPDAPDGRLAADRNSRDDVNKAPLRQGLQRHFYSNGTLAWEGAYDQGVPIHVHRTFFPNGTLKQAIDYSEGSLSLYDSHGSLIHQGKWPSDPKNVRD